MSSSTHQRNLLTYNGALKARKSLINYEFEEDSQQFHLKDLAEFQLAYALQTMSASARFAYHCVPSVPPCTALCWRTSPRSWAAACPLWITPPRTPET